MYLINTIYFYRKNEKYKILQCCAHFYVQIKGKKYIFCHRHTRLIMLYLWILILIRFKIFTYNADYIFIYYM